MKIRLFIIFILLILLMINPLVVSALAPTPTPLPTITVIDNKATVTFAQLGFRDDTLSSPIDATRVLFSLPPNWQLSPGGDVDINYDIQFSGPDIAKLVNGVNPFGGALSVVFNQQIVGSIPLDKVGSGTAHLLIPPEALITVREDGRHQLTVALDAGFSCNFDIRASVIVKATSSFHLPFVFSPPILNLSKFPAPFYLPDSLIPDQTRLVIPDNPSVDELRAALNIMAGLGSMVGTEFDLDVVNIGALTDQSLALSNLIFVGKPAQLPALARINFPNPVVNGQFANLPIVSINDGILEMALSPWNPNKVVLLVSGNTDTAVSKAASAVSSGRIFLYTDATVSYVSDVKLLSDAIPVVEDFNFKTLGYNTQTLTGIGLNNAEFDFFAAKEQVASQKGFVDLVYYHSGLLDYGESSLSVSLNDQLIGSVVLTKETEKLSNLQIDIPTGLIRFGQNRLVVSSRMAGSISCKTTSSADPWLVVVDQSKVHLPSTAEGITLGKPVLDLKSYPGLFLSHSDLGDIAFILPKSAPDTIKIAGKLAFEYGKTITPVIPNLAVAFADDVPLDLRSGRSLIVIGLANTLPFLAEINDKLPAPFNLADNTASEANMQITYRLPDGVSVGYLELLNSPFNIDKSILVASGNTSAGLAMAGNVLLLPELESQLAGLFSITNGTQVASSNAIQNFSVVGNLVSNAEPVVNIPLLPRTEAADRMAAPIWLFPLIGVSILIILLTLFYVIGGSILRRRSGRGADVGSEDDLD